MAVNSQGIASITISPLSDGVTFDFWVIQGHRGFYEAFGPGHSSLGSLAVDASLNDVLGTHSFKGLVHSLEWSADAGFVQVSMLTINAIPEPETYALMLAGLGLPGFAARRRNRSDA